MEARLGRLIVGLLGALLVVLAAVALVAPRPPFTAYRQPVVVVATVLLLALALLWRPPAPVRRWCAWRGTGLVVTALAFVVALATGHGMRLRFSWDVLIVLQIAGRLHDGDALSRYQQGYLSRYPNNTAMVGVDRLAHRIADLGGWPVEGVLVTLAAVGAAVAVWAVHRMVLPVGGAVRAVAAALVTTLLVAASPWVAVPYTDIMAVPFLSVGLLLAMSAMRRRPDGWALLLGVAAGACVGLAAAIKTIPYVVAVALLVTGVLVALAERADRRVALRRFGATVVAAAVLVATGLGAMAVVQRTALGGASLRPEASAPMLWWLANGMTQTGSPGNPPRYGGFNEKLGKAISGMTRSQATDWAARYIRAEVERQGPVRMAEFYGNKAAWNWGDGMFWAWGEGADAHADRLLPGTGPVHEVVRAVDRPQGRWYPIRSDLTQAVWLTVLAVTGLGALATRRPRSEVLLLALSVLGVMVFTLLFQGRSRYLFTFVPLVVALTGMVHPAVARFRWRRSGPAPT